MMLAAHLMDTLALLLGVMAILTHLHRRMKRLERLIERGEHPHCNCVRFEDQEAREEPIRTIVEPAPPEPVPLPEARASFRSRKFG